MGVIDLGNSLVCLAIALGCATCVANAFAPNDNPPIHREHDTVDRYPGSENAVSDAVRQRSYHANQCLNNEGEYVNVKLLSDDGDREYPYVQARCSGNGYMIVDVGHDENWLDYLSSHRHYHRALLGPVRDDVVNWDEWFKPEMTDYVVSPDCQACEEGSLLNQQYSTHSGYYMMSVNHGCTQLPIGRIGCDMDYDSYECRACGTLNARNDGYWDNIAVYNGLNEDKYLKGEAILMNEKTDYSSYRFGLCGFTIRSAVAVHSAVNDSFAHCKTVTHEDTDVPDKELIIPRRKPSLGSDGQFCMCVKPHANDFHTKYEYLSDAEYASLYGAGEEEGDEEDEEETYGYYELYQSDFEEGTYRITKPGKYVVMEDILFDFNGPDGWEDGGLDTYNDVTHWWPSADANNDDEYPGANDLRGAYFLGFYAGIAIESSSELGVVLDLNGHTLRQSKAFYYQQSFFALISLSGQVFLPGQGPGFFGADPAMAENVVIKNGKLGLTSHHGIQGNMNKNVVIDSIEVTSFKTHGIQLNGFENVKISNVDVHHNQFEDKLSPFYAHLRHYLGIHRKMVDEEYEVVSNVCLDFNNREDNEKWNKIYTHSNNPSCVTLVDYVEKIEILLNIAFEFAVFDKTDEELLATMDEDTQILWNANKGMLINSNRDYHPWTATMYGIFLNYIGSNVIGWYAGSDETKSTGATIENVAIHDLTHDTTENVAFSQASKTAKQRVLNCLNAPFNAYHIFGTEQVDLISECNMYRDPDSNPLCEPDSFELSYVGNILTDVQIATFYLVNNVGLSWNYCSGGAADLSSLMEFAMNGEQFFAHTPQLATTHDPMIHPGKGILGLRLNGVNNAKLKNIEISGIRSLTALGSLIAGSYEFTVSQQKPYMRGFSMNMANGLTVTMCNELQLNNINVNNVVSHTGLAYGVAIWYETTVLLSEEIMVSNILAGAELTSDPNYVSDIIDTDDYMPNRKPEACAIRLYDDDAKSITVKAAGHGDVDDLVRVKCVQGYTGCLEADSTVSMVGSQTPSKQSLYAACMDTSLMIDHSKPRYANDVGIMIDTWDISEDSEEAEDASDNNNNNRIEFVGASSPKAGKEIEDYKSVAFALTAMVSIMLMMMTLWVKCGKKKIQSNEFAESYYHTLSFVSGPGSSDVTVDRR